MTPRRKAEALFVLNLALLATHEIDSAYWHEWALFGLPGGIQLFLVLNLALLVLFLVGLVTVVRGCRSGVWFSLGLAATGVVAFVLHAVFLLWGHPEFRLPTSLALLLLILPVSVAQAWYSASIIRESR